MKTRSSVIKTALTILIVAISSNVYAERDKRKGGDERERSERNETPKKALPEYKIDRRYDSKRQYPSEGRIIRVLPERRRPIYYQNKTYFFFEGAWYLPSGPNFVVVRPPIGIIVPVLPAFYTTLWFHGLPYYYANDVYYMWRPDLNGYQVTEAPDIETEQQSTYLADELFIYPKEGQSKEQQAEDRYACHRWGVEQTSYDPIQPPGNLTVEKLREMREDYQRAMKACLEGRGYSVR